MNAALLHAEPHAPPLLSVSHLNVGFGPVRGLSDVELTVAPGELVALAGEPGAGKSALVRCIAGDIAPADGEILLDGRPVPPDPGAAGRRGISVVWQDLVLCDNLDVAGNVLLGGHRSRALAVPFLGWVQGTLITRLGLPSFIVTLGGLLGFEGVMLEIANIDKSAVGGVMSISSNSPVYNLVNGNMSPALGWIALVVVIAVFSAVTLTGTARRKARGLSTGR